MKDFLGQELTSVGELLGHARGLINVAITKYAEEGHWQRWLLNDAKKAIDLAYDAVDAEHDAIMRKKLGPMQND